jgi:hypothetical protein
LLGDSLWCRHQKEEEKEEEEQERQPGGIVKGSFRVQKSDSQSANKGVLYEVDRRGRTQPT